MTGANAVTSGAIVGRSTRAPDVHVDVPEWMQRDDLACTKAEPEAFFPPSFGLRFTAEVEAARQVCLACPVLAQCREWAVDRPELDGIWGATTPLERRRIRRDNACT